MLLDDLVTAIQTVQQRIREHGSSLSQNEYRTRISLIDPLLNAFGWDVSDPKSVTLEHHVGSGRADYALLDKDGDPRTFIEAKRLGENLESEEFQEQVFTYALRQRLKFIGLTDGNRWIIEDLQARLNGSESRILDITLSTETPDFCARKILYRERGVLLFRQTALPSSKPLPLGTQSNPPAGTSGNCSLQRGFGLRTGWIPLADFEDLEEKQLFLKGMYIPDKGEVELVTFSEFIVETAEWLIRQGALNPDKCPKIEIGGNIVVGIRPAQDLPYSRRLSNGLCLYTVYRHPRILLNASKVLIEHTGKDPFDIWVRHS